MKSPKVSIIILNWNGLEETIECLESLKKITYPNYEVIVVDNGSEGNDADILGEKYKGYITIIRSHRNYGFTGGNNIAIRHTLSNSDPDYLLLLNNDTTVDPQLLTELVRVAEANAAIGIVGPKIYFYDFPDRIQSAGAKINMRWGRTALIGVKQIDVGQYDKGRQVDCVLGCCLLIKRQVIEKVGLLDESYFCYWEETDYCLRAKRAGYKTVYVPRAKIWHKLPVRLVPWYRTLKGKNRIRVIPHRLYYITRNSFKFMKKHATTWQYFTFLLFFFGYHFWFMIGVCIVYHRDIKALIVFYRGVKDGLLARGGDF